MSAAGQQRAVSACGVRNRRPRPARPARPSPRRRSLPVSPSRDSRLPAPSPPRALRARRPPGSLSASGAWSLRPLRPLPASAPGGAALGCASASRRGVRLHPGVVPPSPGLSDRRQGRVSPVSAILGCVGVRARVSTWEFPQFASVDGAAGRSGGHAGPASCRRCALALPLALLLPVDRGFCKLLLRGNARESLGARAIGACFPRVVE